MDHFLNILESKYSLQKKIQDSYFSNKNQNVTRLKSTWLAFFKTPLHRMEGEGCKKKINFSYERRTRKKRNPVENDVSPARQNNVISFLHGFHPPFFLLHTVDNSFPTNRTRGRMSRARIM